VLEVNLEKNQIALTMKSGSRTEPRAERPAQQERRPPQNQAGQNRKPQKNIEAKKDRQPQKSGFNNPFADLAKWKK
ncbi:MAG TPA: hypothetical protein VEF04_11950, partial [Blastocatellia bacterium]|nr:hypothetical protein [Blastocatellia bacterium]